MKKDVKKKKSGQITIFIILAIFIVAAVIMIFFMLRSNPSQEKIAKTYNLKQNENNIVSDYQLININNTPILEGYAYDQNNHSGIMSLLFYIDGTNESNYAGKTYANIPGTCGALKCNNRFTWEIPRSIKDSNTHTIGVYTSNGSNIISMILIRNDIKYTCVPECEGKECGSDMCNGACGNCLYAYMCNNKGKCVLSCRSKTCQELGKKCGTVDDGCGNKIDCGKCEDEINKDRCNKIRANFGLSNTYKFGNYYNYYDNLYGICGEKLNKQICVARCSGLWFKLSITSCKYCLISGYCDEVPGCH